MLPAGLLSIVSLPVLSILSFCVIVCCVCRAVCWCIFIFFEAFVNFLKTILSALAKQALLQFLVCALACANCKCAYTCGLVFFPFVFCFVTTTSNFLCNCVIISKGYQWSFTFNISTDKYPF